MSQSLINERTWAEVLTQEYKEGASDIEVCDALRISMQEFNRQYKTNPEFKELVDIGRLAEAAWWKRTGRKNLTNKSFNNVVWMFNMKNRFGWAEKSDTTTTMVPEEQKTLQEMQQDVLAKLPGLLKRLGVPLKEAEIIDLSAKKEPMSE